MPRPAFPPAKFLFENWLRAVVGTSLCKVIAWIMMGLVMRDVVFGSNALLQKIATANGVGSEIYYNVAYLILIALALVASIGAFLVWQVPVIASIYADGSGASLKGFGKGAISKMIQGNGAPWRSFSPPDPPLKCELLRHPELTKTSVDGLPCFKN